MTNWEPAEQEPEHVVATTATASEGLTVIKSVHAGILKVHYLSRKMVPPYLPLNLLLSAQMQLLVDSLRR
jgi:hypothetical protein